MNNISNCPICNTSKRKPFLSAVDYTVSNDTFNIVECVNCTFRFTNPIPTEDKIGKYYKSEDYISHSGTKKGIVNRIYHVVRNYTLKKKHKLISKYTNQKKLLDIGCGTGDFLNFVKDKGFEVKGLEPDNDARKIAQKKGADVSPIEELHNLNNESFDVITMWHVLEHVYNLNKDIQKIKTVLKKDGILIIAVPNCNSYDAKKYKEFWAAYDLPIHLYHFRPNDILNLFETKGMEVIDILPMKFDSYYVSLLSEKYKSGNKGFSFGNLVKGFFSGLVSNIKAKKGEYSSQIYIIKHKIE